MAIMLIYNLIHFTIMAELNRAKAEFLTVEEFKAKIGKTGVAGDIVKNPNTGKLFLSIGGLYFKVQQDIDRTKDMSILVPEDGGLEQACLVNVKASSNNVQFTL